MRPFEFYDVILFINMTKINMEPVNKYVNNSHLAIYSNRRMCGLICNVCLKAKTWFHSGTHGKSLAVTGNTLHMHIYHIHLSICGL